MKSKINFNHDNLRKEILFKYGSLTNFAKANKTHLNCISRKLKNETDITVDEIVRWSEMLDIKDEDISKYFFDIKVYEN